MSHNIFSANAKSTGSACFVTFQSKEQCVFFRLLKQVSWDAKARTGSFKDGATVNIKFSPDEVGDIIRAVRVGGESRFYHSFNQNVTSGSLGYYEVGSGDQLKKGFGLTVKNGDLVFKVGLSLGGAERLMEYLKFALQRMNEADYVADKKMYEERLAAKKAEEKAPVPKVIPKTEQEPVKDGEGDLF